MSAPQSSRFGLFFFVLVFALCLALSFGVGYRLGRRAVAPPAAPATDAVDPLTPQEFWSYSPAARPDESAPARAEPAPPAPAVRSPEPAPVPVVPRGKYALFIASLRTEESAREEMRRLAAKGVGELDIVKISASNGTWYRLRQGRYMTKDEATAAGRQMTDAGTVREFWVGDVE